VHREANADEKRDAENRNGVARMIHRLTSSWGARRSEQSRDCRAARRPARGGYLN
jgi:hypothetical protein